MSGVERIWAEYDKAMAEQMKRQGQDTITLIGKIAARRCIEIALSNRGVPCETTAKDIARQIKDEFEVGDWWLTEDDECLKELLAT